MFLLTCRGLLGRVWVLRACLELSTLGRLETPRELQILIYRLGRAWHVQAIFLGRNHRSVYLMSLDGPAIQYQAMCNTSTQ